jgi:hypothetical protein
MSRLALPLLLLLLLAPGIHPFSLQTLSGWRLLTLNRLQATSGRSGDKVPHASANKNHSRGNSDVQSLRYLPSKTPSANISPGVA